MNPKQALPADTYQKRNHSGDKHSQNKPIPGACAKKTAKCRYYGYDTSSFAVKFLSALICVVILFGSVPAPAFAVTRKPVAEASVLEKMRDGDIKPFFDEWNKRGYISKFPDGVVPLYSGISRGEFSYFIMNLIQTDPALKPVVRDDIPKDAWYKTYLEYLLHAGIMPTVNGKAEPEGDITRLEAVCMLAAAFKFDVDTVDWDVSARIADYREIDETQHRRVAFAGKYGIIELINGEYFLPGMEFTYYDAFVGLETIRILLDANPSLGTTYANQFGNRTAAVRFYADLIDGIKNGKRLKFLNTGLQKCYTSAKQLLAKNITDEMNDAEKGQVLHDQLVLKAKYDVEALAGVPGEGFYSPIGVLVEGKGGCESYARAYEILLSMCGIESMLIVGTADGEKHMWNLVKLGKDYYHVDTTWDDPAENQDDKTNYYYLYLNDDIMSQSHSWERSLYPSCKADKYNYYVVNNAQFDGFKNLEPYLRQAFQKQETQISIRIVGYDAKQFDLFLPILERAAAGTKVREFAYYGSKDCVDLELKYS